MGLFACERVSIRPVQINPNDRRVLVTTAPDCNAKRFSVAKDGNTLPVARMRVVAAQLDVAPSRDLRAGGFQAIGDGLVTLDRTEQDSRLAPAGEFGDEVLDGDTYSLASFLVIWSCRINHSRTLSRWA